jgi:hypothetical protein
VLSSVGGVVAEGKLGLRAGDWLGPVGAAGEIGGRSAGLEQAARSNAMIETGKSGIFIVTSPSYCIDVGGFAKFHDRSILFVMQVAMRDLTKELYRIQFGAYFL